MGRKTWESIPENRRPLKNRLNIVLTKTTDSVPAMEGMQVYTDFNEALVALSNDEKINEIFVIGGAGIYEQAMGELKEHCKLVIATRINQKFECDTFIPNLEKSEDFSPLHIS